MNKHITES